MTKINKENLTVIQSARHGERAEAAIGREGFSLVTKQVTKP